MEKSASFGLIGVGTMGGALALNIAEKGRDISLYNLQEETVDALISDAGPLADHLKKTTSVEELVSSMTAPRAIILLVPAGKPVEMSIDALIEHLEPGDTIIDGGNSDFRDTQARTSKVEAADLRYLGIGISGGAEGARHGPSMMVGGTPSAYAPIKSTIEAIAADFEGSPCAAHLGPDGAGHFVKTVHNGIEYADMEMIAEIYGTLRDAAGLSADQIGTLFEEWDEDLLHSYLVEITAKALKANDPETGKPMVDLIVDKAGQKGTGRWTAIEAIRMGVAANTVEAAVGARVLSSEKAIRIEAEKTLKGPSSAAEEVDAKDLESALLCGRIIAYAQGFQILKAASEEFDWNLDHARIAEIWRAGCIIRSGLLDDISAAFRGELPHGRLVLAPYFADLLNEHTPGMRRVLAQMTLAGVAAPALSAALSWYDAFRSGRGFTNLTQAQRDFFGAHGFERIDRDEPGQHGPWGAD